MIALGRMTLVGLGMLCLGTTAQAAEDKHIAKAGDLLSMHVWTRATTDLKRPADVFLEVEYPKQADQHVSVAADFATQATVVGLMYKADVATPVPLGPIEVPARGKLEFAPSGIAIRLEGLKRPLRQGREFQVRLTFEKAGSVLVTGEVMSANAQQHGHAGHSH